MSILKYHFINTIAHVYFQFIPTNDIDISFNKSIYDLLLQLYQFFFINLFYSSNKFLFE